MTENAKYFLFGFFLSPLLFFLWLLLSAWMDRKWIEKCEMLKDDKLIMRNLNKTPFLKCRWCGKVHGDGDTLMAFADDDYTILFTECESCAIDDRNYDDRKGAWMWLKRNGSAYRLVEDKIL